MKLSRLQKWRIHQAATAAGYDEARYRDVLQECAGVRSAADDRITRAGFIRVMARFEGECFGRLPGFTAGYWLGQDMRGDPRDAVRFAVRRAASELGWSTENLDTFLAGDHCSSGRCRTIADATPYWLGRCLDALKAIRRRRAAGSARESSPTDPSPPVPAGAVGRCDDDVPF